MHVCIYIHTYVFVWVGVNNFMCVSVNYRLNEFDFRMVLPAQFGNSHWNNGKSIRVAIDIETNFDMHFPEEIASRGIDFNCHLV